MADFKETFPKPKPFKCCAAWHLRKSGNLLAIYDFLGALTNGGKNHFFSSIRQVAIFFFGSDEDAAYETCRQAFRTLKVMGFIRKKWTPEGNQWEYVPHDEWAATRPGKCQVREMFPWQEGSDPFVGAIWKLAKGKIRISEKIIKRIREVTTDEEFLESFRKELVDVESRRVQGGDWQGTSAKSCFWRVYRNLWWAAGQRKVASV